MQVHRPAVFRVGAKVISRSTLAACKKPILYAAHRNAYRDKIHLSSVCILWSCHTGVDRVSAFFFFFLPQLVLFFFCFSYFHTVYDTGNNFWIPQPSKRTPFPPTTHVYTRLPKPFFIYHMSEKRAFVYEIIYDFREIPLPPPSPRARSMYVQNSVTNSLLFSTPPAKLIYSFFSFLFRSQIRKKMVRD